MNPDDSKEVGKGKLYIVATPIGNLGDMTLRALETLREADLIAAEDTRRTRKLLSYFEIHKPTISYHEHNAIARGADLLEKIFSGKTVALVTDAGTPCISDPGRLLVEAALERGIEPVTIPGPTALIAALVVSGLPAQPFVFLGFPPAKGAERRRFFQKYAGIEMTLIVYEAPKRLLRTLKDIEEHWGDRKTAVARELTKVHEEIFRGRVSEALSHFEGEVRGEVALVVEGAAPGGDRQPGLWPTDSESSGIGPGATKPEPWQEELDRLLAGGLTSKEAVQAIVRRFGLPRRIVYQAALKIKNQNPGGGG